MPPVPKHHYILIGINHYIRTEECIPRVNDAGRNYWISHLRGCVGDIEAVEDYLLNVRKVDPASIHKLISAPQDVDDYEWQNPAGDESTWPTYKNIVDLFAKVTSMARKDTDFVYIHYAGHGGSSLTVWPEIKGEGQRDESIIPCDVQRPGGQYIRDLEFAVYLNRMVAKGLKITLVLDSCHSSGATRDGDDDETDPDAPSATRSAGFDATPAAAPPFTIAQLKKEGIDVTAATANSRSASEAVDAALQTFNIPTLGAGYEMLAGCRFDQKSKEQIFAGSPQRRGILTYYYLQTLRDNPRITHHALFQRVRELVNARNKLQVPVFVGKASRYIFEGVSLGEIPATVAVKNWEEEDDYTFVTLAQGALQAVRVKSEYLLFPYNAPPEDFKNPPPGTPKVRVTAVNELSSRAVFVENPLTEDDINNVVYVALPLSLPVDQALRLKWVAAPDHAKLTELQTHLDELENVPVELVDDAHAADYFVTADDAGRYVLLDGTEPIKPTFPAVPEPHRFVQGLSHLARYRMVHRITNSHPQNMLRDKYEFSFADIPQGAQLSEDGKSVTITNQDIVGFAFTNKHSLPLNVCILNLQPEWGIEQIVPSARAGEVYLSVPAGHTESKQFKFTLPSKHKNIQLTDFLKAFVFFDVTASADFSTLCMPHLAKNMDASPYGDSRGSDDLMTLFESIGIPNRNAQALGGDPIPWDTAELAIHVKPLVL